MLAGLEAWRATGVPLAVLTNKPAAFTEPLLERMGLKHYFSAIVSGDSTPFRKPHPDPLRHACTQMGRAVNTNLHIGDSRHEKGGRREGIDKLGPVRVARQDKGRGTDPVNLVRPGPL